MPHLVFVSGFGGNVGPLGKLEYASGGWATSVLPTRIGENAPICSTLGSFFFGYRLVVRNDFLFYPTGACIGRQVPREFGYNLL